MRVRLTLAVVSAMMLTFFTGAQNSADAATTAKFTSTLSGSSGQHPTRYRR